MKLNILSDLHLGFGPMDRPENDADVVVLAGDISRHREAVAWALRFERPVIYVPGNHEFYGSCVEAVMQDLKQLCARTQVHVLDDGELVIGNVRFLGTTLWSDFKVFGEGEQKAAAMAEARQSIRDFSRIRGTTSTSSAFTPEDAAALFEQHATWLDSRLRAPHDGPTVVVTHHAPSAQSIHPRFTGSLLNACFVSRAEHLLGADRVQLWVHGHTHDSFDYMLNGTRVVCNPRGYAKGGINENPLFDPDLMIEIGGDAGRAQTPNRDAPPRAGDHASQR
ncbi:metallophosphoesterase [Azohydromonas australica]|uniref:metallophosphoesterase n=1 Tax=Azohydromonas australica TaxID=364039 RepID=UPI00040756F7|nr:metallophosphoesterase [Azohydromonas australica]